MIVCVAQSASHFAGNPKAPGSSQQGDEIFFFVIFHFFSNINIKLLAIFQTLFKKMSMARNGE